MTEQGAFLDGHDVPANHEAGWSAMLDSLEADLRRDRAATWPKVPHDARHRGVVPNERVVPADGMHMDAARISVSLATVELLPAGAGTRLVFTEQGAFLDGHDTPAQREQGTGDLLDALGSELRREPASA